MSCSLPSIRHMQILEIQFRNFTFMFGMISIKTNIQRINYDVVFSIVRPLFPQKKPHSNPSKELRTWLRKCGKRANPAVECECDSTKTVICVRNGEKPLEKINLFIYLCTICMQTESIASKLLFALICVDGNWTERTSHNAFDLSVFCCCWRFVNSLCVDFPDAPDTD